MEVDAERWAGSGAFRADIGMNNGVIDRARRLREAIVDIPGLDLMPESVARGPGAKAIDPTHVSIDVIGLGITGFSAADWLREHRRIHVELADHRRVMALISFADGDDNIDRLIAALRDLSEHRGEADPAPYFEVPAPAELRMPTEMLPRDAFLGSRRKRPGARPRDGSPPR